MIQSLNCILKIRKQMLQSVTEEKNDQSSLRITKLGTRKPEWLVWKSFVKLDLSDSDGQQRARDFWIPACAARTIYCGRNGSL